MKRIRNTAFATALLLSSMVFQSCPISGLIDDCLGEETISRSDYEDMGSLEQLLYEENSCGRYEPVSDIFDPFF